MLQFIRDQASGWIAWVVVILICIPFALWGLNEFQGGATQQQTVANVNGTEIGIYAFQQSYQNQRQQLQQIFGGQLPALYNEDRLRQDTIQKLVNDELIIQLGLNTGMRVGDGQLAQSIQALPLFTSSTGFSNAQYTAFLQSRGLNAASFEMDMRRSILSQQLITGIRRSAIITESQIEQTLKLDNEMRRFLSLRVVPSLTDVPSADDAQLKAYFESHKDRYIVPEQVKIEYIELSRKAIAAQIDLDEAALRRLYDSTRGNFGTAEQREVRHILVQVDSDADTATAEAAEKKINALSERLRQGENFADLAKAESDDPGSAASGGNLGFFGKGVMDPAFEKTAYSLLKDQLSAPVRSSFGWHLIEVTSIQEEGIKAFEEVRDAILESYRDEQADQIFAEQIDQLATLAFEQPESLQPAAEALGVEITQSEFFSPEGLPANNILSDPRVLSVAFTPELRDDGNNSELLELGADTVVVIRAFEYHASQPRDFPDARDEIAQELKREAATKRAQDLGNSILQALENGTSRDQATVQHDLKWSAEFNVNRRAIGEHSPELLEKLFKMPKMATGETGYAGLSHADGGYSLIALLAVETAKPGDDGVLDREQIEQTLSSNTGERAFSAMVKSLRERSDIQTFVENVIPSESF